MKETLFPFKRYIIPRDWFDYIMNNSNFNDIPPINNVRFLNSSCMNLKNNIDERKVVLLIFELMNYIHKMFLIDYIIQANISIDKDNILNINNIQVFDNNEFNETNVSLNKCNTKINETYLKYPHFQIFVSKGSDCSTSKKVSINERELISRNDKETISTFSNTKYSFKEDSSLSSFNLDLYKKLTLIPLGLKNPSFYCYMNCCLQIFLSIPELNYYFLHKKYKQEQNHKTLICDDISDFISLYQYFQSLKETQMELPPTMFNICHSLVPKGIMNDCEEFFFLLLKSLQEELNSSVIHKNCQNGNNEGIEELDMQKRWKLYREMNSSFIDSIFTGYIRSTVICNTCNKSSFNYEPFMNLSVPIPKSDKSINRCINIYFEIETINCDYHCYNCNNTTSVSFIFNNIIYFIIDKEKIGYFNSTSYPMYSFKKI